MGYFFDVKIVLNAVDRKRTRFPNKDTSSITYFSKDVRFNVSLIFKGFTEQSWRLSLTSSFNVVYIRFRLFNLSGKQSGIEGKGLIPVDETSGYEILGWKLLLVFKGWARDPRVTPRRELCKERLEGERRGCKRDCNGSEKIEARKENAEARADSETRSFTLPFFRTSSRHRFKDTSREISREKHTSGFIRDTGMRACASSFPRLFVPVRALILLGESVYGLSHLGRWSFLPALKGWSAP